MKGSGTLLGTQVRLHDVEDAEAFVRSTLHRSGIRFEHDEFEDLVCEGLALLWQLAASYDARRGGHAQDGRFSGYAAMFLPKRLGDAWHRRHPEQIYASLGNGQAGVAVPPRSGFLR